MIAALTFKICIALLCGAYTVRAFTHHSAPPYHLTRATERSKAENIGAAVRSILHQLHCQLQISDMVGPIDSPSKQT